MFSINVGVWSQSSEGKATIPCASLANAVGRINIAGKTYSQPGAWVDPVLSAQQDGC